MADVDKSDFSELFRYSPNMMTGAGVTTVALLVLGIFGNILTIIALITHSKLRTVAAAFIVCLSISDMFLCIIVLPFSASQFLHGKWIHGDILCIMIPMFRYGSVAISLLSIAMISVNRFILVAYPHLYKDVYTKTKVAIYIFCIWFLSYGIQMPIVFEIWGKFGFDERIGTCSITTNENGYTAKTFLFIIGFLIPCIVILTSYANIYKVVKQSHKKLRSSNPNTIKKFRKSEMQITKMVSIIFVCFLVSYLPLTIVKIFDHDVKYPLLHIISYLLIYTSSCINPIVYVTMNTQYRDAYINTFLCRPKIIIYASKDTPTV